MSQTAHSPRNKGRTIAAVIAVVAVILLVVLFNQIVGGKFLSLQNFNNILTASIVPALVGWGLIFLFNSGITDLSAGAVIIICSTVTGILGNSLGYVPMIIGGILTGVVCVLLNMFIFQVSRIPSWIAGLGMTMLYEAVMAWYAQMRVAQGLKVVTLESHVRALGKAPWIYVTALVCFAIVYIVFNNTSIGLNTRAVGSNSEVARMLGIDAKKALLKGALMSGFFFGAAGVVKESYSGLVIAATGLSSISTIFQPLAAVLLAQALSKYINMCVAVPISAIIIALVFNVLTLLGVPSGTFQEFLLGVVVVVFGILAQRGIKGVVK